MARGIRADLGCVVLTGLLLRESYSGRTIPVSRFSPTTFDYDPSYDSICDSSPVYSLLPLYCQQLMLHLLQWPHPSLRHGQRASILCAGSRTRRQTTRPNTENDNPTTLSIITQMDRSSCGSCRIHTRGRRSSSACPAGVPAESVYLHS